MKRIQNIIKVQSNSVIRNGFIWNKLVLRNRFLWPICHLLHKDKELLALNNFRATKKFLIAKFDCITKSSDSFTNLLSEFSIDDFLRIFVMISIFFFNWQTEGKSLFWTFFLLFHNILSDHHYSDLINSLLNAFKLKKNFFWTNKVYFFNFSNWKKNLGQNLSDEFINRLSFWVPFFTSIQKMFKTRKWNKKYCVTIWSNWQNYAWHSLKITCKTLAWNIVFCQPFRFWKLLFGRILLQKHVQFFPHARFARNLRSQIH